MKRFICLASFLAAAVIAPRGADAQWTTTVPAQLEFSVRNTTTYKYQIKLDGVSLGKLEPGEHIHVRRPHGLILLEAVPLAGGPRYSQRLEMHRDFVWLLKNPVTIRAQEPEEPATPPPMFPSKQASPPAPGPVPSDRHSRERYYTQFENAGGIKIKAPACVDRRALSRAKSIMERMFAGAPNLHKRLADQGIEIVIFGRNQQLTDLPETTHLKGKLDSTGDRYDEIEGMSSLNRAFVSENNLLGLPADKFPRESVLTHEVGHLVMRAGLEVTDQHRIFGAFLQAMLNDSWEGKYAATDPGEYFAELTQSFFGVNDPVDHNGGSVLQQHDSDGFSLVAAAYSDRPLPESKASVHMPGSEGKPESATESFGANLERLKEITEVLDKMLGVLRELDRLVTEKQ